MAICPLSQIKPVLTLAKVLGLNWFETQHHHTCPPPKTCQVRSHCFSIGSLINILITVIVSFSALWIQLNVWNFVSAFFVGVEQFTYGLYIILYYWQTPSILIVPRFSFRPLPKLWGQMLTISNQLNTLKCPPFTAPKKWGSRLGVVSWTIAIVTLIQNLAYNIFFTFAIHSLCDILAEMKAEGVEGNCYSEVFTAIGLHTTSIMFFVVCICPQVRKT